MASGSAPVITRKAARLIAEAPVLAYPALKGADSFARAIAADLIAPEAREIVIDIPMTTERGPAQAAYDAGAARIAEVLGGGEDVVCLCEGDPFFYGSFMYLFERLMGSYPCQVVPGVSSMMASGAVLTMFSTGSPRAKRSMFCATKLPRLSRRPVVMPEAWGDIITLSSSQKG